MKKMAFGILFVVAMVTCIGASAIWLRSQYALDVYGWSDPQEDTIGLAWSDGELVVAYVPPYRDGGLRVYYEGVYHFSEPSWLFPRANLPNFWGSEQSGSSGGARPWPPLKTHETRWRFAGFVYQVNYNTSEDFRRLTTINARLFLVPIWPIPLVAAVLPAARITHALVRKRRAAANCCTQCGYDLRATPGRCPECGTEPAPRKRPAGSCPVRHRM